MRSAYYDAFGADRSLKRRRIQSIALTVLVHLLLVLLLLKLAPPDQWRKKVEEHGPVTFQLTPDARKAVARPKAVRKARSGAAQAKAATAPPPVPVAAPKPTMPALIPGLEHFSLSQVRSTATETASADDGKGKDSASAYGPGEGPGGVRLYNAEWYREPTDAELSYYLPAGHHIGWALIACQTVERFHVDNCRVLGDSPAGSGLARAVRQAAWQFLVRPPRIDGRPVIGAWVRIRIDFSESGAAARN
jgi:protein TonB